MAVCVNFNTVGQLVQTGQDMADCTAYALVTATEYSFYELVTVSTPEELLWLYTWGFGAILLPWSIGYAIGVAKKTIKLT